METNIASKNKSSYLSPFAKNRLQKIINIFVFGLLMGAIMAFFANLFVNTVSYISSVRDHFSLFTIKFADLELNYLPLLTLIIAALLINFLKSTFKVQRWNGPADAIYAAHRTDNELDIKIGYLSTLTALISASGGASVGQYGPLVHLGATIGTTLKKVTKDMLSIDVFLGCGVAGAISAGFGAPLAGIIFAHEAILRHFSMRALAPIAIASFTATATTNLLFGKAAILGVSESTPELVKILPASLLCSPIFALIAIVFMVTIRFFTKLATKSIIPTYFLTFVAAIVCGITGMFFPQILGLGTGSVVEMLSGNFGLNLVIAVLILKVLMTGLCLGFGLFGGVFSPALFVGTAAGSILGKFFTMIGFAGAGAVLPFCGMAAVGGAIIGAPITAVLIILEITGSYEFGLVTMASVAGCCLITHLFFGHSFFDRQLIDRGINVHLGRGHLKLMAEPVKVYSSDNYCGLQENLSVKAAIQIMLKDNFTEAYVIDEKNMFKGKVIITDLININQNEIITKFFVKNPLSLSPDLSVLQSIEACRTFVGESIPIIENKTNIFRGIISEADLFSAYLDLDKQIKDLESG